MDRAATNGGRQDSVWETLLTAIARGRRWQAHIDDGSVATVKEIAERIGCNESYVARVMRLSLMSPAIIRKSSPGIIRRGLFAGADYQLGQKKPPPHLDGTGENPAEMTGQANTAG